MKVLLTDSNVLPNGDLLEKYNIKLELLSELSESNSYMMIIPDSIRIVNSSTCIPEISGQLLIDDTGSPIVNISLSSIDPMRHPDEDYDYISSGKVIVYPIKLPTLEQFSELRAKATDEYYELIETMKKSRMMNMINENTDNNENKYTQKNNSDDIEYNDINTNYIPKDFNNNKHL